MANLSSLVDSWASLYANHAGLRTVVVFLHIGGLTVGGGGAIAADRMTLAVARSQDELQRAAHLEALARTHRVVVTALGVIVASGLLQFASDTGTFLHSAVFWTKMTMVAVLVANGGLLVLSERKAASVGTSEAGWRRLRAASIFSIVLWLAIALAGAALVSS